MKVGGTPRAENGFTIVETLIVLAVTGLLFISAVILISGRANKTQFTTSANDLKQQFEQIINEASSGYFPDSGSFTCTSTPPIMPKLKDGAQKQGTNGGCVFLGKAVQLGVPTFPDKILVFAIAGNRLNSTGDEASTLHEAMPEAIAPGNGFNNTSLTGITQDLQLESGLAPAWAKADGTPVAGFAMLSTLASYSTSCNGICSGAQTLQLYGVKGTAVNATDHLQFADKLDADPNYVPAKQITACFNSGTTSNQSALYTIGGSSGSAQGVAVDIQIQSGACS
ncbi:MAG TPA: type II secretion system protein [Candidatus Saccharimonadales bacterium]|nr:type II secretion system protein [Candidatus Saccharimonadales bacterium]